MQDSYYVSRREDIPKFILKTSSDTSKMVLILKLNACSEIAINVSFIIESLVISEAKLIFSRSARLPSQYGKPEKMLSHRDT